MSDAGMASDIANVLTSTGLAGSTGRLAGSVAVDPVCGAPVFPDGAELSARYLGEIFYFCSMGCLEQFERDPYGYIASDGVRENPGYNADIESD